MGALTANVFGIELDETIVPRMKSLLERFVLSRIQTIDMKAARVWAAETGEWQREPTLSGADRVDAMLKNRSTVGTIYAQITERTVAGRTWTADKLYRDRPFEAVADLNLAKFSPDYEKITIEFAESGLAILFGKDLGQDHVIGTIRLTSIRSGTTQVHVEDPNDTNETLLADIEDLLLSYKLPTTPFELPPLKVFMGHGGDHQWKSLKLALESTNGFAIEAFESEERAGSTTLGSVRQMIESAGAAVVIMTATDEMRDGTFRARENVIHEIGLSQGILGVSRTIILCEQGVSEFSNIAGLTQIRFPTNDILSVAPAVAAALDKRIRAAQQAIGPVF
ncbi:hypothetical protein E3T55_01350 [Cryobacterium frigoriphilum]|uniref:CD-NTase-associated protein 12/Pycsar effector protein TIR domain-containing protein n=1 Tax=Cryobacterium frigoriphilum TaxID=1259150 RepID=A0A4R9AAL1_9MICO|nr:TIR domain-containing protein [Cryobacterium frigoriphilum]TFD55333.1 hypothetical protein E3T55_01350 [Cryobacterium frigoriphilum]